MARESHDDRHNESVGIPLHVPRIGEEQWAAVGAYLLEGLEWLGGKLGLLVSPPVPAQVVTPKARAVVLTDLELTLRQSPRAMRALRTILEELERVCPNPERDGEEGGRAPRGTRLDWAGSRPVEFREDGGG